MGDVVNLRIQRKRAMRLQESKLAAQVRTKHGATKHQRLLAKAEGTKADRDLDQQRLETGEGQ